MEKTDKRKLPFNFIDLILIIILVSAILILTIYIKNRRIVTDNGDDSIPIEYTIVISDLREEFKQYLTVGDALYDTTSGEVIGEIHNINFSKSYYVGTNGDNGEKVNTEYPGRVSVTITVQAKASRTDSGYSVSGTELLLSGKLGIRTSQMEAVGVCTSVNTTNAS